MNILITGSKGFIGKNLISQLNNIKDGKAKNYDIPSELTLYEFDVDTNPALLDLYTKDCDFVFHLAGVNRPENQDDFMKENFGFTSALLQSLKKNGSSAPILITSSIQAELDNPYGKSKREGEKLIFSYGEEYAVKTYVYRLPNVFGKWCRANYNSAVATFCNNIANNLEITVNDPEAKMQLVYIDDVIDSFLHKLAGSTEQKRQISDSAFEQVKPVHTIQLGEIVKLLYGFKDSRHTLTVPRLDNAFEKALYSTYLSYLPVNQFCYPLKMNCDDRGSFTEIIRTSDRGQFSVNISKPHITKGNHWHHTKNEKFAVVSGRGLIQFRKIGTEEVIEYHVSGDQIAVVDIPTGYTHNIINEGETDMVTFMWCNECFDPDKPDTYFEEV